MADHRYYIGKITSHIEGREHTGLADILDFLIDKRVEIGSRQENRYAFLLPQTIAHDGSRFFYGQLTRFNTSEVDIVEESSAIEGHTVVENLIMNRNKVILEREKGIVAFSAVGTQPETVANRITELVAKAAEFHERITSYEGSLQILNEDEYNFREKFNQIHVFNKLKFNLRPSNPNSQPLWERFDDKLQRFQAKGYQEKFDLSQDTGGRQQILDDEDVILKMQMALDGYGSVEATGSNANGERMFITTVREKRYLELNSDLGPSEIVRAVAALLKSIARNYE